MYEDPIVSEVRRARREIQEEAGNDLHEYFERLRRTEEQYADRVVDHVEKRLEPAS